ncbi:hypothetical protein FRC02_001430 [Tulasnella sp. 418]|nr:hypothetical protein FRC02_001430 [Tulasnella sp. 418]
MLGEQVESSQRRAEHEVSNHLLVMALADIRHQLEQMGKNWTSQSIAKSVDDVNMDKGGPLERPDPATIWLQSG